MRNNYFLRLSCCLLLTVMFLWGCGAGPGTPGSSGTEDTGVMIEAYLTPTYNKANSYSADVIQQICGDPAAVPVVYEYMADHTATLTMTLRLLNTNTKVSAGTMYIEKYTIEYKRSNDSLGAPPIQSDTRYQTIVVTPPAPGTGVALVTVEGLTLVDLTRKFQYYADVTSGQYTTSILNNYTATYTFEGQNQYGTKFSFVVQTNFQIGSFDNCA